MRPITPFTETRITRNHSDLREATGFWSGRNVLLNPGAETVILDRSVAVASLRKIVRQAYLTNVRGAVAARVDKCIKLAHGDLHAMLRSPTSSFRLWFPANLLPALQRAECRGPSNQIRWTAIAGWLESLFPGSVAQQRDFLVEELARSLQDDPGVLPLLRPASICWLHIGLPEFMGLLDALPEDSIDVALEVLGTVRQFGWNLYDDTRDRKWAIEHNAPMLACLRAYNLPFCELRDTKDGACALGVANAAELLLALLVQQRAILLPAAQMAYPEACRLAAPDWPWKDAKHAHRPLLQILTSSSTVREIADLPADIKPWLTGFKASLNTHGLFTNRIASVQHAYPDLPPWPVSNLHGTRRRGGKPTNAIWSSQAIATSYGTAWGRFAEVFLLASDSGLAHFRIALRNILKWADQRHFTTPAQITVFDLIDPSDPLRQDTFKHFLLDGIRQHRHTESTAWGYWHSAAHAFGLVANALKIRPDRLLSLSESPFAALENPFRVGQPNKTTRRRLPSTIHEAMIEVLLDLDDNGKPTYRWARTVCTTDWLETRSVEGVAPERVWCPSRCSILALLLMLPIRAKQARWLDRGLMDSEVWDVAQQRYVKNPHPLCAWRYPDHSTHAQRYGRPSGVLQPMSDAILDTAELGIFINTNKTQMWDPSSRRGYEMPWPFVQLEHETDIAARTAMWLNRPYAVIFDQLKWMNQYCPEPVPVSFADSLVDRLQVNDKYIDMLPVFTPLFADVSQNFHREDDAHTRYHLPVAPGKIYKLFNALSVETERRLAAEGRKVTLTQAGTSSVSYQGRISLYEIHGLRVAGISRLIEMGVPVNIVQEFIAGHVTAVMTMYYNKAEPGAFKAKLVEALKQSGAINDWNSLREPMALRESIWAFNRHHARYREEGLLSQFSSWKTVPGGICPVGGTGCHIGTPSDEEEPDKVNKHYSPVEGGCGNCRFFSTGPAFMIQQAQAMNELMLELRSLGRARKTLYEALSELTWTDIPEIGADRRRKLAFDSQLIKEQIASLDQKSEPLILEWINRYRMYTESTRSIDEWRSLREQECAPGKEGKFVLITGSDGNDIRNQVEVKFEKSGDFSLLQNILEAAVIQGGLEKASTLSKETCSQFMDRILRVENCRHLLMDIQDERLRHEAAYLMACMAEHLTGKDNVQNALDRNEPLPLAHVQREEFRQWVDTVLADAIKGKRANALAGHHNKLAVKALNDERSQ